jgi:hypothetical protein
MENQTMPVHDWTLVNAGLFHEFHQSWCVHIKERLNRRALPKGFYALVEQRVNGPEPDIIAVETKKPDKPSAGTMLLPPTPSTQLIARTTSDSLRYAQKANRISIRHALGEVVAVIEIVSPGNKESRHAIRSFRDKSLAILRSGIHLVIVDLFPPSERDPLGIHHVIWSEFTNEVFQWPAGKNLTCVSYEYGNDITAYIEPIAVSDPLPSIPLYLEPGYYVPLPLEETYQTALEGVPEPLRELLTPTQS